MEFKCTCRCQSYKLCSEALNVCRTTRLYTDVVPKAKQDKTVQYHKTRINSALLRPSYLEKEDTAMFRQRQMLYVDESVTADVHGLYCR